MPAELFTQIAPGVRRFAWRVDAPQWSPDGAYVALWRARESDPDLVARERVYCVEAASGREVFAVDGPDIVRAVGWAGPDTLLVQRDVPGGARLTAHAVPDGGEVAEQFLADGGHAETALQCSRDGRVVLAAPVWRLGPARHASAYVLRAPALEVLAAFDPQGPELSRFSERQTPSCVVMDDDGACVALGYAVGPDRGPCNIVFAPTGVGPARSIAVARIAHEEYSTLVEWAGPDRVVARAASAVQTLAVVPVPPADASAAPRLYPPIAPSRVRSRWASTTALDPAGRFVAVASCTPEPNTAGWRLLVVALDGGAVVASHEVDLGPAATTNWVAPGLAWSHDARGLVLVRSEGRAAVRWAYVEAKSGRRAAASWTCSGVSSGRAPRVRRLARGYEALVPAEQGSGFVMLHVAAEAAGDAAA